MASAWGSSWGLSWGVSWGIVPAGAAAPKRHWILPNGMRFYGPRSEVEALMRRSRPEQPEAGKPVTEQKQRVKPPVLKAVTVDEPIETVSLEPYIRPVDQVITDREEEARKKRRRKAIEILLMAA